MKTEILGKFKKGKFIVHDFFKDEVRLLEGKDVKLIDITQGESVSDELRGYYFAAVIPFIKSLNEGQWDHLSPDQIHEILKKDFNFFEAWNPLTNRVERYGQSVAARDRDYKQMLEYLKRIETWLEENYGQSLPDSESYRKFKDIHIGGKLTK